VIVFGLFHGLIFLPAVLGLIGPGAYTHDDVGWSKRSSEIDLATNDNSKVNDAFDTTL
jgi:hypothetical protein